MMTIADLHMIKLARVFRARDERKTLKKPWLTLRDGVTHIIGTDGHSAFFAPMAAACPELQSSVLKDGRTVESAGLVPSLSAIWYPAREGLTPLPSISDICACISRKDFRRGLLTWRKNDGAILPFTDRHGAVDLWLLVRAAQGVQAACEGPMPTVWGIQGSTAILVAPPKYDGVTPMAHVVVAGLIQ